MDSVIPKTPYDLAQRYLDKQEYALARYNLKIASDMGHPDGSGDLGWMYMCGIGMEKDFVKAREYYEKAIEQGNEKVHRYLANLYYRGLGTEIDYLKAFSHYWQAYENGDGCACNNLGAMYYMGHGYEKDIKKACKFYILGNNKGCLSGRTNLLSFGAAHFETYSEVATEITIGEFQLNRGCHCGGNLA